MNRQQKLKIEITAKDKDNLLIQLDEIMSRIEMGVARDRGKDEEDNSFEYDWNY